MFYGIGERARLVGRDSVYASLSFKRRFLGGSQPPIYMCNTYPKSGTHLLSQILMQVPGFKHWNDIVSVQSLSGVMNSRFHLRNKIGSVPAGSVMRSHLMYDPFILETLKGRSASQFFLYRDLRDVAVSHANWVLKEPRIFLHKIYKDLPDFDACLSASILGTPVGSPLGSNVSQPNIAQDFSRWKGWIADSDTFAVKFEDLVGSRGGGDEELRIQKVKSICDFVGYDVSQDELVEKFSSGRLNPEESHTFRKGNKGAIGGWKTKFKSIHKEQFKEVAGDLLVELGYEKDLDW